MSTTPMVKITIDGTELEVPQGSMIIEAADNAKLTIPRFCYHKKLSVAANCRMCLVEASNSKKPVPACATPVADGVIIQTKSPKALAAQKAVMEFLLINHPLDCPICDQGGECELQDMSMGYGKDISRYNQGKRSVEDKDIGPLIETDLTRCIQCTRCVRFGTEIAGMREMGMINRGEHSEIATFMEKAVDSELSGNVIDLCPVGALTNKPFRYKARAWELVEHAIVAPHDCLGSNMFVHVRRGEVMRAVPRENEKINETWLSDRDRYGVHSLNNTNRATTPMLKKKGKWLEVSWEEALEFVVDRLNVVKKLHGADKIASFSWASSTVEEFYLLQKLMRGIGTHNMDYRGHMQDFAYQNYVGNFPNIDISLADLQESDLILVLMGDLRKEVPILNHRILNAVLNGARVEVFTPNKLTLNYDGKQHLCNFSELNDILVHLLQEVVQEKPLTASFMDEISRLETKQDKKAWADLIKALLSAERPVILGGQLLLSNAEASKTMGLINALKEALNAKGGYVTLGANSAGAWLAGYLPHRGAASKDLGVEGLTANKIFDIESKIKAYILVNSEPGIDSLFGQKADEALKGAEFSLALTSFVTYYLKEHVDVILPISAFTETAGSFVNIQGEWQSWTGVATPKGEARPLWKVLRVLGNLFELPGFDYGTHEDVLKELRAHLVHMKPAKFAIKLPQSFAKEGKALERIGYLPLYSTDLFTRESLPLQMASETQNAYYVGISATQAKELGIENGEFVEIAQGTKSTKMPAKIMELAKNCVILPRGIKATEGFGEAFTEISLRRA